MAYTHPTAEQIKVAVDFEASRKQGISCTVQRETTFVCARSFQSYRVRQSK